MARTNHTLRPSQAIKDALWHTRQNRSDAQDANRAAIVAAHLSTVDALYAADAFTRTVAAPGLIDYTFTGSATGARATVVYDCCSGEYHVSRNATRFFDMQLIEALKATRLEVKLRKEAVAN